MSRPRPQFQKCGIRRHGSAFDRNHQGAVVAADEGSSGVECLLIGRALVYDAERTIAHRCIDRRRRQRHERGDVGHRASCIERVERGLVRGCDLSRNALPQMAVGKSTHRREAALHIDESRRHDLARRVDRRRRAPA